MSNAQNRSSRRYQRFLAGAAATLALGGSLAACGSSQTTTASTTATTTSASGAASTTAYSGTRATPPGFGTEVTGAAAAKAKSAALAKYPGAVERVMQLDDGSYVVHVIRSSGGEVHVTVSKDFAVTGVEQGMPGRGIPGGRHGMRGLGKEVTGTAASKAKAAALAKYPGTVERVVQLADGSYEVHVIRSSSSEVHVKVSKSFEVTGTEQGMPRPGATPSGGGTTS